MLLYVNMITIYRILYIRRGIINNCEVNMLESKLMQKVGIATTKLACKFFALEMWDRIPTVEELANEIDTSRGTIQTALSILQEEKAVKLVSRGHLGTYIVEIDRLKILEIADSKTMVGVMPLPYSKKYEGLATGIFASLENRGISSALAFMRGSDNRLKGLIEHRYDFAVISQLTAQYYIDRGENIRVVDNFGSYSYVDRHVLLLRDDDNCKVSDDFEGYKIGIDYSSMDQKSLTTEFFKGKNVDYIPLIYSEILPALRLGRIDAAVWNVDDIDLEQNHLCCRALESRKLNIVDTEAVIVCLDDNEIAIQILKRMLDREEILQCQREVLSGNIIPRY